MDSVDLEVLRTAVRWLAEGRRVALATVVRTWGSSPRPVGALAAFGEHGRVAGSVSGGCVEDDLLSRFVGGFPLRPEVARYGVTRDEAARFGLPCGGTLELAIEPLASARSLAPVLEAVETRRSVARRLDLATGKATIVPAAGDGPVIFDGRELTRVFGPRWRMLLIGAGQLSRYLAEFALALDYQVLVCDPREEYAQEWKVAGAELLPGMPDEAVQALVPDERTAIVALTHDPKLDDMALMAALKSRAFYVGALGSRANNARRRERLKMLDLTGDEVTRLRGPVGLPLGGRTPPEIAVAILAELTALRHGVRLVGQETLEAVFSRDAAVCD
ncbi:XdhC family protein [Pelomicrobium sp. G1]|uniref:XdhC family protein n=1 Tax=unclassified Pelomicrobium TaxID=2815318 RepID=UPI003F7654ED